MLISMARLETARWVGVDVFREEAEEEIAVGASVALLRDVDDAGLV
jgi:hypothetical protein